MKHLIFVFTLCGPAAALAQAPAASAASAASAPRSETTSRAGAAAACERAAQETLQSGRREARSVSFNAPPSTVPGPADGNEMTLRGAGRVQSSSGSRPFSYSCNYDVQARQVSGVVVRDAGGAERKPAPRSVEPDLSNVSPAACESSAASALKRRWPSVTRIVFNSETRQLSQDATGQAHLRGQGTAEPQVGGPSTHFSYDCAMDARSGRITGLQLGQ
jgi:hypothetical protein